MRRCLVPALTVALLAPGPVRAADQATARAIVENAVKAHGGADRLSKVKADRVKIKGVIQVSGKDVPFVAETVVSLPGKFRNGVELSIDGKSVKLVQILNGEAAHMTLDGQPQKLGETTIREMRETLHLDRAVRLWPLVTDRTFELATAGEAKVADRPALGIKVTAKGHRDVLLYFDKESGLLVKTVHTLEHEGKEVKQEEVFADYREYDGMKRPTRVTAYREGKKVMEGELVGVKYLDKVDDAEFKP